MNSLTRFVCCAIFAVFGTVVMAEENAEDAKPELETVSLKGAVQKTVGSRKTNGKEIKTTSYSIKCEDGQEVTMPKRLLQKLKDVDVESLVSKQVQLEGKGQVKTYKNGKKKTFLKEIKSLQLVADK